MDDGENVRKLAKALMEAAPITGAVVHPDGVVWLRCWCVTGLMTGLVATTGVAGEGAPDGAAGHWTTSGAGAGSPGMSAGAWCCGAAASFR